MSNILTDRRLLTGQIISGLTFATFLIIHIANTLTALWGQKAYDAYQTSARQAYQIPIIEIGVIFLALGLHAFCSLVRIARRWKRKETTTVPLRLRLHRYSAWYLLLVILGHIVATRSPAVLGSGAVDMAFLTFSLQYWPWFFYPYYFGFFLAGIYHLLNGLVIACAHFGLRLPQAVHGARAYAFWSVVAVLVTARWLSILSMGGLFKPVDTTRFAQYRTFYEAHAPHWLLPWKNKP